MGASRPPMTGFISSVWRWRRGTSWTASATDSCQDLLEEATRGAGRAGDERLQLLERNPGIHLWFLERSELTVPVSPCSRPTALSRSHSVEPAVPAATVN